MDTIEKTSAEEKQLTWGMVTQVVRLSKLQIKNILRTKGLEPSEPEQEIQPEELILILAADMLEKLVFLQPEQRTLILDSISSCLSRVLMGEFNQLVFVDGQYCLWTGNTGFLDINTGDTINELPAFPIESISYNLNELYRRGKLKIERRSGFHAKRQDTEGDVEEPENVCERSTDSVSG
jgi:hypothetical protein